MKLSIALGIVLAASSSWSATAFAPSALSPPHAHRSLLASASPSRASSSRLSMVGGGMIERPPGDSSKDDGDAKRVSTSKGEAAGAVPASKLDK